MASDVFRIRWQATGKTIYAIVNDKDAKVADQAAGAEPFVTFVNGNIGNYDFAMAETPASSRRYQFTFPSWVSAGSYDIDVFIQAGGSPAITDQWIGTFTVHWDGSAFVSNADILSDTNELQTDWADGGRLDLILDGVTGGTTNVTAESTHIEFE